MTLCEIAFVRYGRNEEVTSPFITAVNALTLGLTDLFPFPYLAGKREVMVFMKGV